MKCTRLSKMRIASTQFLVGLAIVVSALAAVDTTIASPVVTRAPNSSDDTKTHGSVQASTRLMKELMETYKSDSYKKGVFSVELVDDNLYEWQVKLFFPDPEHALHGDLEQLKKLGARDHVLLRLSFPQNYPSEVPFARTVYPLMRGRPNGALCMYLLSPQGWIPDCTVEALILTIIDHMVAYKHRVDIGSRDLKYSEEQSLAFQNFFAQHHGWNKPKPKDQAWYEGPNVK